MKTLFIRVIITLKHKLICRDSGLSGAANSVLYYWI